MHLLADNQFYTPEGQQEQQEHKTLRNTVIYSKPCIFHQVGDFLSPLFSVKPSLESVNISIYQTYLGNLQHNIPNKHYVIKIMSSWMKLDTNSREPLTKAQNVFAGTDYFLTLSSCRCPGRSAVGRWCLDSAGCRERTR